MGEKAYNIFFSPGATQPIVGAYFTALYWTLASSRTRLLDHTQRRATVLYPARSRVERIMDVIPRGTELELQLRRGVGQALYTCNNIHIRCTGVYWAQAEKYCYK